MHTRSSCTALRLCTVTPLTHGAYVVCAGDAIFAATVECVLGLRVSLLQLQRTRGDRSPASAGHSNYCRTPSGSSHTVGAGWDAATRQKAALPAHDHQIKPRSWWTPETQSVFEGTGSIPGLSISVHGKGVHNKEPQQRQ
jgi:hypothetical protein